MTGFAKALSTQLQSAGTALSPVMNCAHGIVTQPTLAFKFQKEKEETCGL